MIESSPDAVLDDAADRLRRAERPLFITGAGISADSGLPTYRGIGGLYSDRQTEEGIPIEEALSGRMLACRPEIAWRHIARIERNCRDASPCAAHRLIAALEAEKPGTWVLTQNIDSLHRKAGSKNLIEIHGTVYRLLCTACDYRRDLPDYADYDGLALPLCPQCSRPLRPDVVLFGEMLPAAALAQLAQVMDDGPDMVFSIGTTSLFPYIAHPVWWAKRNRIAAVEINPGETEVSSLVSHRLKMGAAQAMEALWLRLRP
ncbi:MAG: NAD-dependent protein deacylase [Azoarcus sp.]|jgi:NAD-dependent deacetylase|nr:NAD-dependent protein deacylase [Azoarcus sp.]